MVELSVNGGSSLGSWETGPKYYDNEPAPITPNKPELVPGLLDRVISLAKTFDLNNNKERLSLLEALRSLIYALETPHEANQRQRLEGVCHFPRLASGFNDGSSTCRLHVRHLSMLQLTWECGRSCQRMTSQGLSPSLAAETGADPALLSMPPTVAK